MAVGLVQAAGRSEQVLLPLTRFLFGPLIETGLRCISLKISFDAFLLSTQSTLGRFNNHLLQKTSLISQAIS